jgi:hypothetical protein
VILGLCVLQRLKAAPFYLLTSWAGHSKEKPRDILFSIIGVGR